LTLQLFLTTTATVSDMAISLRSFGYYPAFVASLTITLGLSLLFAYGKAEALERASVNAEKLRLADQAKGAFMQFLCHEVHQGFYISIISMALCHV
jgi:hypothetical protein